MYDPEFIAKHQDADGLMIHEVEHLLRDHSGRRGDREPSRWNGAADREINDDLTDCRLPAGGCYPEPGQEGRTAEEYYESEGDSVPDQGCGGGAGGEVFPGEAEADADAAALGPEAAEEVRHAVAEAVISAAQRGDEIAAATRMWAEALIDRARPKIPVLSWRGAVRALGSGTGGLDYAARRRRIPSSGPILPALRPRCAPIRIVVDTSGSMGDLGGWVGAVLREVLAYHDDVTAYPCDTTGKKPLKIQRVSDFKRLDGGGGTDLRPAIDVAARGGGALLVVTDGETPWPERWPTGMIALVRRAGRTEVYRGGI
jgi:predicted metal-dependent peptidase